MRLPFTKMQGLGNDFVVVRAEGRDPPAPDRIRAMADRRRGIGFDQLLWLEPPRDPAHAVRYRIFNADGSEAEQCGNGARCIARVVAGSRPGEFVLEHAGGTSRARIEADGSVTVAMNVPEFVPARIPFRADAPAPRYALVADGTPVEVGVVSMGNPHAVLQVADIEAAPVARLGPPLERHERFPNRANIGFMQVVDRSHIRLRVFERGAGETQACGTGACAAVVIGRTWQLLDANVTVRLPGGELRIRWEGAGQPVWMTGEAITVFEGTVEA
jgi:diaminopimelate epimerase